MNLMLFSWERQVKSASEAATEPKEEERTKRTSTEDELISQRAR
jgi:hypothetical protein